MTSLSIRKGPRSSRKRKSGPKLNTSIVATAEPRTLRKAKTRRAIDCFQRPEANWKTVPARMIA